MKPVLSLSTCWCSHRHTDGYAMVKEMVGLGFDHIELSHGIRITLVPGILRAVEEGLVKISSTHNFCPLPTGITHAAPNLFEPSAADPREHDQWVRHTKRSIDFAAQVKAQVVVCHLGSVRFFWFNPGRKLRNFARRHPSVAIPQDRRYQDVLASSTAKLRKRMSAAWERTKQSVADVLGHARAKGVVLGIENRERFEELPVDGDFVEFLAGFGADAPLGYWHDTGHADIKQTMGVIDHRAHLATLAPRLLGFHLHDVNDEGQDHQPVGNGHIDFRMVRGFWRPEHRLVLELSPRTPVQGVRSSRERVLSILGT